jgi:pterin-4a-carbinolamine dehydratase
LTLSTHAAGGITRRDLELAARIDAAAADLAAPAERPEGAERGHD